MSELVPQAGLAFDVVQRPTMRVIQRPGPPFGSIRGSISLRSGLIVPFESLLERRFLDVCRIDPRVKVVESQPFTLSYREKDQRRRTYTPDFLVKLAPGEGLAFTEPSTGVDLLVEVKPHRLLLKYYTELRSKFAAARVWARQAVGRDFLIITDRTLGGPVHENTLLLSPYVTCVFDPAATVAIRTMLHQVGTATIDRLLELGGPAESEQWAMQRAIFRMMLYGQIRVSLTSRITKSTVVSLAPEKSGL